MRSKMYFLVLLLLLLSACRPAPQAQPGTVRTIIRAVDGDTLILDGGERLRIIGVDTPETKHRKNGRWVPIKNPDPRAIAAWRYMQSLEGRQIRLQLGVQPRDRYHRTLGHAWLMPDGPDLACALLKKGWADIMAIKPNTARYEMWKNAKSGGKSK